MYFGGNNYGRAAAGGVTTKYADDVNLHFDALSNEPKRSHLRKLHRVLSGLNAILLANDKQIDHAIPLVTLGHANDNEKTTRREQQAFVYEAPSDADRVVFLENQGDR